MEPLVSCIMPTADRRDFVPRAIDCFLRQDYPNKELIVIDDGRDSIEDLMPVDPSIRYFRLNATMPLGAKRNFACERARGELIAHHDDDDWYAPHRLRHQVENLLSSGAQMCGARRPLFLDAESRRAWRFVYPENEKPWVAGASLCYRKSFWQANRFPDVNVGEDTLFVWNAARQDVLGLDGDFFAARIHSRNTSKKETGGDYWQACAWESVEYLLKQGDDTAESGRRTERRIDEMTFALSSDLELPEFRAYNHGATLPRMRQWELPYALFRSRLEPGMSVLNCTINPVNFEQQLKRLYPDTFYRAWNPIANGAFALPIGIPDGAFDRVICVNTLEHLVRDQREQLFAAMAHRLKPGGWLVIVSDYYFDSSWSDPAFLNAGVMQPDGSDLFNGWNKVRPEDYCALASSCGLEPAAPVEEFLNSSALFLQDAPFAHAAFGVVFKKPGASADRPLKKVVLSLLTWNTRDVSIDSARALAREARMLLRLGVSASLCFCDNGSTDGTQQALRALESELGVAVEFLFNQTNRGSSVARNQIIDHALEAGADYLLFMDGDIEPVPFSTFAMFRYMEDNGSTLGNVGADSWTQTNQRREAAPCAYSLHDYRMEDVDLVAWTQYGMFRREVFESGVRFDEGGPFGGAGWGFEDNDLAFQMKVKGYANRRFYGMTYLHRDMGSSLRLLRGQGADVVRMYNERKAYVIRKWEGVAEINGGALRMIRQVSMG